MQLNRTPKDTDFSTFASFYIHPVKQSESPNEAYLDAYGNYYDTCEPIQADCWMLYGRHSCGGVDELHEIWSIDEAGSALMEAMRRAWIAERTGAAGAGTRNPKGQNQRAGASAETAR